MILNSLIYTNMNSAADPNRYVFDTDAEGVAAWECHLHLHPLPHPRARPLP